MDLNINKIVQNIFLQMDATNAINVFDAVDEEEEDRGGWGNKLDFLFSCISVSVGLGSMCN